MNDLHYLLSKCLSFQLSWFSSVSAYYFACGLYLVQFQMPCILYQKNPMIGWDFLQRILWQCSYCWLLFLIWFQVRQGKDIFKNFWSWGICGISIWKKCCWSPNASDVVPIIDRSFCFTVCYRWDISLLTRFYFIFSNFHTSVGEIWLRHAKMAERYISNKNKI